MLQFRQFTAVPGMVIYIFCVTVQQPKNNNTKYIKMNEKENTENSIIIYSTISQPICDRDESSRNKILVPSADDKLNY